jgi:hypothetical protein
LLDVCILRYEIYAHVLHHSIMMWHFLYVECKIIYT